MNKPHFARPLLIALLSGCSALCRPDTMVKTKTVIADSDQNPNVQNSSVTRTVHYRHGLMRRKDSLGADATPSIEQIANCETKTGFLIDVATHQYRSYRVVKLTSEAQRNEYLQKAGKTAIQVESTTVDTGERKVFFRYPAKHLITTTRRRDSKSSGAEEIIDGWYIDHETADHNCAPDFARSEPFYVVGTALVDYPDVAQIHHAGPLPTGLAVKLRFTGKHAAIRDATQVRTITIEDTVEELSDSPLSPSLFDLPPGLHENPQLFRSGTISNR